MLFIPEGGYTTKLPRLSLRKEKSAAVLEEFYHMTRTGDDSFEASDRNVGAEGEVMFCWVLNASRSVGFLVEVA